MSVIRRRKDGGFSECNAPVELVGKGRCCHVIEEGTNEEMEISKIQRGMYEVKVNKNSTLTIEAQKEAIADFFENLPKISKEKQQRLIKFLLEEDQ